MGRLFVLVGSKMKSEKVTFDDGSQAVAVVNDARTEAEILNLSEKIAAEDAELVLWRIDCFEQVTQMNHLLELAPMIKEKLSGIPLLVVFRSQKQGGATELDSEDAYLNLVKIAIDFGLGDAIDIEMDHTQDRIQSLIQDAHHRGLKVVIN